MWHPVHDQLEPVSPKQFDELKFEQRKKQDDFIRQAIKRANSCLLEIAGGDSPSPYNGKFKGSGGDYVKNFEDYAEWLESDYAQKAFDLVPNLIHLELCHFDAIDPQSVYEELRLRFVKAGWGERTRVHKRSGPDNMVWVSLEPVEEKETFPLTVEQVESMESHRVHYWLVKLKVPALMPLHTYSDSERRQILKEFVEDYWRKPSKIPPKAKSDPYPDVEEVDSMSRTQVVKWLRTLNVQSTLAFDRCAEKRLRRMLVEALNKLDDEEEE